MTRNIIGSGVNDLYKFLKSCHDDKARYIIRTSFGGKKFNDRIILICISSVSGIRGGEVKEIPMKLVEDLRKSQKNEIITFDNLKQKLITDKYLEEE